MTKYLTNATQGKYQQQLKEELFWFMIQVDIVHHSRDVKQEHEGAGHMFLQSGSRPMTASTPVIFHLFLPPAQSRTPATGWCHTHADCICPPKLQLSGTTLSDVSPR